MALCLRELKLKLGEAESSLPERVAAELALTIDALHDFRIIRKALDARRKSAILWVYTVEFSCVDERSLLQKHQQNPHLSAVSRTDTPVPVASMEGHCALVVGMGPAGLFAAKWLAESGAKVTLIDRGRPVKERVRDVERFWQTGQLDPISNVQFGEGGAGTFSDGKLTTRINHPWMQHVLETLVSLGAPEQILVDAKPHIGSDRLRKVLVGYREYLVSLGVDIRFESCLTDIETDSAGRVIAGIINNRDRIPCDTLLLAPGHSARDTYGMLADHGVAMEAKSFAIGVRVEHPSALINRIQYGVHPEIELPSADYTLRYNDPVNGRGVYSFCMCPGGEVINAASESGGLVVNGMSLSGRDSAYSNSALVVTVGPEDWDGSDPLGGMRYQQHWERLAFNAGGCNHRAPAQNLLAFAGQGSGALINSCRPETVEADLTKVLPPCVSEGLRAALPHFDRKMKGFLTEDAVLVGVETRTSAPLRILRAENGESLSHKGLFPAGEGAGYAGGIMSSALDGLKVANLIVEQNI
jgi:uncharacterized FAD-dependent dehydrogenase